MKTTLGLLLVVGVIAGCYDNDVRPPQDCTICGSWIVDDQVWNDIGDETEICLNCRALFFDSSGFFKYISNYMFRDSGSDSLSLAPEPGAVFEGVWRYDRADTLRVCYQLVDTVFYHPPVVPRDVQRAPLYMLGHSPLDRRLIFNGSRYKKQCLWSSRSDRFIKAHTNQELVDALVDSLSSRD